MVKNDKVFELKIQEDDDLSGIDSISLVDEPAIEVNWIAFKKETEHSFEQDDVYVKHLMDKGETEEDLFNDGWSIDSIEILDGTKNFAETNPNAPSFEDTKEYRVRYKYILNPKITGQAAIIPTSRHFCRELIAQNRVWRVEDIESAVNDFGESPLVYRGSFNCRHVWSRIQYKKTGDIINKASVNKNKEDIGGFPSGTQPDPRVLGYDEPSTVTKKTAANPSKSTIKNLGLSKDFADVPPSSDKPKVSLDYDGVLSTPDGEDLAKELVAQGNDVYIVTARNELEGGVINELAKKLRIPTTNVIYTNGKSKSPILTDLGIKKHYDNNPNVIADIKKNAPSVEGIQFDYDVAGLPAYVDQVPRKKSPVIPKSVNAEKEFMSQFEYLFKEEFASHSDYPQEVKDVAKRVLKWVDENGWGSCGTDVGKQRANQLANGEAISESTIHRMYSYLSRHKVDLQSSKSYEDGCGKLMYDSWGGAPALQWAERKIQILNAHRMEKQKFAADEEKHIVLGPAMIPDQKIFRKDDQGNPYYVFFSPDTIKMIADKYMKNKYTDNNDQMHDGEAVKDVYVVESWIKEDMEYDKGNAYGFNELPVGTWFVSMKVNNPDIWSKVKDGMLNGFSVSGYFEEVAAFNREEMFLKQLAEVLKKVKE